MQAIMYRLSFYSTEVLTKGGSGRGPLFSIHKEQKKEHLWNKILSANFPPIPSTRPTHPPLSRLLVKLATPMYYNPTQSTAEICVQQCRCKILTTASIMLTVQTTNF